MTRRKVTKMDEQKIHGIITDALRAANAKFDSDGQTIWVDIGGRRTLAIGVSECAPDDDKAKKHRYTVSLHIDVCDTFEMEADSPEEAEAIVNARVESCDIDIAKLEVNKVTVEAYEHKEN